MIAWHGANLEFSLEIITAPAFVFSSCDKKDFLTKKPTSPSLASERVFNPDTEKSGSPSNTAPIFLANCPSFIVGLIETKS